MTRLSIIQYMQYLGGTDSSRCVYEGEEVLNAGHLILCGKLNSSTAEKLNLCALCLQTSALSSDPHQINGEFILKDGGYVQIKEMRCSCKAGNSGKCKHISALLIKCTREDLQELEVISQTDLKCVWVTQKNITRDKYRAVPLKNMPCLKNKIDESMVIDVDSDKMYDFFIKKLPDAAISKHSVGRRKIVVNNTITCNGGTSHQDHAVAILNNACQSVLMMELFSVKTDNNNDCCKKFLCKTFSDPPERVVAIAQQSIEWHEQRKYRVTGSRIYELYTYCKDDWETKSLKYFYPKTFANKFTKHGIKYENSAKEAFAAKTGLQISECGMVISHINPWLGFSPDGIIFKDGKPVALLEVKCLYEGSTTTITEAIKKATFLVRNNGKYFLKERHKYNGQVQLGMGLLNVDKCYLAIYASFDKSLEIIEIKFDINFATKMLTVVKAVFFDKMVHSVCKKC